MLCNSPNKWFFTCKTCNSCDILLQDWTLRDSVTDHYKTGHHMTLRNSATCLALSILFCIIAYTVHAVPSQNSVETDIAVLKNEVKNLKESMNTGFANVQKEFEHVQKNFDDIQKNFDRQNNIIIACIGIPMVFLTIGATIWGILTHRRNRQIETLTQEIETLKQKRIDPP